jgi:methanethiol oxidase
VKVIEGEEVMAKTGYAAPHTVHCGPDGIYMNALGAPDGDGPGGIFMLDHETFEVKGRGRRSAARSTSPTTSGGTSATTR